MPDLNIKPPQHYRVVWWHSMGRGMDSTPRTQDDALEQAAKLRAKFCGPGGGLLFVGIEEIVDDE